MWKGFSFKEVNTEKSTTSIPYDTDGCIELDMHKVAH